MDVTLMSLIAVVTTGINENDSMFRLFLANLGMNYQVLHGENPDGDKLTATTWGTYFWYTIFLNIICLNLLIAILSNTFDNVQTSLDSTIYKI
jgi:hypothetical protein